jgi:glycosyltransferase involved in cell wall biosynthesis
MSSYNILFFADQLPPLIGGMEMHASYFIEHFNNHHKFPLSSIVTKNEEGRDCIGLNGIFQPINIKNLADKFNPTFVFFNSGRWIEELKQIREMFVEAIFIYRTGGNEILKAPLSHKKVPNHSVRQAYWVENLNDTIDLLITNSDFTEKRLREIGITCQFFRCVGGVNDDALKCSQIITTTLPLIIFCAARFVPYKNHALLISVIHKLTLRGHNLRLRLAGDGPLLTTIKEQVLESNLSLVVDFLGTLDNQKTCQEIAGADIYMQLSTDYLTEVPGGSYVHSECMGRSILEALTAGTFIVAGKSGALPEIVTKDHGILVELNNFEQLINEIEQIIKNPPAKKSLANNFGWAKVFGCYEELFEHMNENIISHRKM